MNLSEALPIAERVKARLAPYCSRIEIAGSIRRRKANVGDIEIVCIPALAKSGNRDVRWAMEVMALGRVIKGDPAGGKYILVRVKAPPRPDEPVDAEINVDIFTAVEDNYGLILAIRTGSCHYSHFVLACGWVRNGFHSRYGFLHNAAGDIVPVREERDLFALAGAEYVEPEFRNAKGD